MVQSVGECPEGGVGSAAWVSREPEIAFRCFLVRAGFLSDELVFTSFFLPAGEGRRD